MRVDVLLSEQTTRLQQQQVTTRLMLDLPADAAMLVLFQQGLQQVMYPTLPASQQLSARVRKRLAGVWSPAEE